MLTHIFKIQSYLYMHKNESETVKEMKEEKRALTKQSWK